MVSTMMMVNTPTTPSSTGVGQQTTSVPTGVNYTMVPRCTFKVEKCKDGLKLTCPTSDKVAASMVQNLCSSLAGGMCCCTCVMNGVVVCSFNFTQGVCKCESTKDGVCFTYTSGDDKYCKMIQSCCETLACMNECGCTCVIQINGVPVCCCC